MNLLRIFFIFACVSIFSLALEQDSNSFFKNFLQMVNSHVKQLEDSLPGWNGNTTLEKNLYQLVAITLDTEFPGLNPHDNITINIVRNVVSYLKSLDLQGFDEKKSISTNVNTLVDNLFTKLPFPYFIMKDSIKQTAADYVNNFTNEIEVSGFDVSNRVDNYIGALVDAFLDQLGVQSGPLLDVVNSGIGNILNAVHLPGFSPNKTLEDNVTEIIENMVTSIL